MSTQKKVMWLLQNQAETRRSHQSRHRVCTWQMDHGSHVVNNCHLYPLKPFISQGLQVSEVICCFIAVGGNNFNLVLEDKKDISIFWYTWSYLQVSVNVQKCLKWKWLQYKLGILSSNFRIEFCKTQCHTQSHTQSSISDMQFSKFLSQHLYFYKIISEIFFMMSKVMTSV